MGLRSGEISSLAILFASRGKKSYLLGQVRKRQDKKFLAEDWKMCNTKKSPPAPIWGCSKTVNYWDRPAEPETNRISASVSISTAFVFGILRTPGQGTAKHRGRPSQPELLWPFPSLFLKERTSPCRFGPDGELPQILPRAVPRGARGRAGRAGRMRPRRASPPAVLHGCCRGGGASRWPARTDTHRHVICFQ